MSRYGAGRWVEAETGYRKALATSEKIGIKASTALLRNLGISMARNGKLREGLAMIRRSMRRAIDAGDIDGEIRELILIGGLYEAPNHFRAMCRVMKEAEERPLSDRGHNDRSSETLRRLYRQFKRLAKPD